MNRLRFLNVLVTLFLALTLLPVQPARAGGSTMFVDADSNCVSSCGGSWATAFPTLQTALEGAGIGAVYWVAEGVYYPDEGSNQVNNSRTSTYALMNGVQIYGGFNGTETLLSQRNVSANLTILSGDIDKNDVNTDGDFIADTVADIVENNAYHVVTGSGTDNTAILDGFTITAGQANGTSPHDQGGGMYNSNGSPTLRNMTITANRANVGGGMRNASSNPNISNTNFNKNEADFGGGMANWNSSPYMTQTTFHNNVATNSGTNTGFGGGMHNWNSSPTMFHFGFGSNSAISGGGMYNASASNPQFEFGYFSLNDSQFGGGMYNINSNPGLWDITFTKNSAGLGGGMYNDSNAPLVNRITFEGNTSAMGGGMYNTKSNSTVLNSTFSGNTADTGGGMYLHVGEITLTNVTFSGNSGKSTADGGGIWIHGSTVTLNNTLIANSLTGGDCAGGSVSAASSNNLIEDASRSCGLTDGVNGNVIGVDPKLDVLAANGGEEDTDTHALLPHSPAIDAGDTASCPTTDQRNITRPQGSKCDIGAYELEQSTLTLRSQAANDGWILESAENTTVGGTMNNDATVINLGDGAADKQYRAIVSFNTANLPDNAIITSVTLRIKKQGLTGTDPFTILGALKADVKNPFFGGALGLAIGDFQAAAGKIGVATFSATPVDDWYRAGLNANGKNQINKTGSTQFRLYFATDDNNDNAADYMKFFSGNHATASVRPTLVINYYVP